MNVKIEKFKSLQPVFKQDAQKQSSAQKSVEKPEQITEQKTEDFFAKNKLALSGIGAITLGGVVYAATRGKGKSNIQTHFERLNCFGRKIIEDLKLNKDGQLVQKQIEHDGIKYHAGK